MSAPDVRLLLDPCRCCVRRCGARRSAGERGFCGLDDRAHTLKTFVNCGEEAWIGPSLMVYFTGCNMRCLYCSVPACFAGDRAECRPADPEAIAREADAAFERGDIAAIQFLGGEPSCSAAAALDIAAHCKLRVRKVWNSNFTFTPELFEHLDPVIDRYVADLKFGNDACAEKLGGLSGYLETVLGNLHRVKPEKLLIRHLMLGGHYDCCTRPVLDILKREFPDVPVGFHELIPDAAGRTRPPSPEEWRRLERDAAGLRRVHTGTDPRGGRTPGENFTSEIVIRPDGTLLVQDLSVPVRKMFDELDIAIRKEPS